MNAEIRVPEMPNRIAAVRYIPFGLTKSNWPASLLKIRLKLGKWDREATIDVDSFDTTPDFICRNIQHLLSNVIDDIPLTGPEFQALAMRTASGLDADGLILNGVMGLNGEAGECIDIVKKHLFQGHRLDEAKLIDELSDVLWYAAIICEGLGVTLDDVMRHNVEKLQKRYPNGFSAERSIHREDENGL